MAAAKTETAPATAAADWPPKGMKKLVTSSVDGWYEPVVGEEFRGKVVSAFRIASSKEGMKDRDVVVVEVSRPCSALGAGEKDKGKRVELRPGQLLGVGIRFQLVELLYYVEHQGTCAVKAVGKKSIGRGQNMWEFEVYVDGKRANPPQRVEAPAEDAPPF